MILKLFLFHYIIISLYCKKVNGSYNAAVVEYHPVDIPGISEDEELIARAKNHIDLLKNIKQELEIIVYPEKTVIPNGNITLISTQIPKKLEQIICNSTDNKYKEYLKLFSCAAIESNTTIAINVIEKENSPSKTTIYYNTVVAFNEKGYVSGRYRKWNLFGEFPLSSPEKLDVTVITTKNNISFGIITCFDINFNVPSMNLIRDLNIKNIIFPNRWISELPYLTALQVEQMWAHENNVILLASGANNPKTGASGSGIFIGQNGPIEMVFIGGNGGTKTIVQTVNTENNINTEEKNGEENIDELAQELDDFFLLRDLSMDGHTSVLMNENQTNIVEKVCNGDTQKICCSFDITIKFNNSFTGKNQYKYHLVAFNGIRSFSGLRYAGIEACGLIACLNDSLTSCGLRFSNYSEIIWPITFENINMQATFLKDKNRAQYPNSLLSSLRPIHPKFTSWEKEEVGNFITRRHILKKSENRLLTFGIFGRDFSRDSSVLKSSGAPGNFKIISIMILLLNVINLVL